MRWDQRAHAQAGVITYAQLTDCGLSKRAVRGLIERGELSELHPHVYLHSSVPPRRRQAAWAAVLWCGGVLSHRSAAAMWGLEVPPSPQVHVTVGDLRFRRRVEGVRVHRVQFCGRDASASGCGCDIGRCTSMSGSAT